MGCFHLGHGFGIISTKLSDELFGGKAKCSAPTYLLKRTTFSDLDSEQGKPPQKLTMNYYKGRKINLRRSMLNWDPLRFSILNAV